MGRLAPIKSYKDMEVWQKGRVLVRTVYQLTDEFPDKERFCLTQQIRRAAISVPSNIAEGHSRHGLNDYIHFISIAIGSLAELDTQIILACDLLYIDESQQEMISEDITKLQRQLHALRQSLRNKRQETTNA